MAGTVVADTLQAAATSTLLIQTGNGSPVTAVSIDTSQNVQFSGAIRSNVVSTPPTIQDSAGTQIGTFCRAWVNFNGTGTVAIRASFNVTSITDNGTGNYTVSLANAMPDASYSAVASSNLDQEIRVDNYVAGNFRIVTDSTVTDASIVTAAIFR